MSQSNDWLSLLRVGVSTGGVDRGGGIIIRISTHAHIGICNCVSVCIAIGICRLAEKRWGVSEQYVVIKYIFVLSSLHVIIKILLLKVFVHIETSVR